jgi:hypothetical protein
MAEYFELAAMRDRDESQPAGPCRSNRKRGGRSNRDEDRRSRNSSGSTPGALMVSPATGSVGYFFRSGLRGRARRRRPSAGNSPIASTVSNAESSAPTRSCKPAIGERMISGSAVPWSDYRSERLLGVPKECKRTIEFAGGGLRIGQLKLQTGDPSNSGLLPATPGR